MITEGKDDPTPKLERHSSQDLNFKVDPALHRAFKMVATLRGISMKELFELSFGCFLQKEYGDDQLRSFLQWPNDPQG